jgi:hypothetical protein
MKDLTSNTLRYKYPYVRKTLDGDLSPLAKKRLKWMLYIASGNSVVQCSRHFDIPLRTIWYWLRRYDLSHPKSLENKSRRPHKRRFCDVPLHHRVRIKELRKKYPWGKKKIQKLLQKEGIYIGQSNIQKIINRAGLKRIRKKRTYKRTNRRHMYSVPREYLNIPGGLVYFDVKHLGLPGGQRVYQFTAIDHATRTLFVKIFPRITSECGKEFFLYVTERLKVVKISYVGSDNGSEFLGNFEKVLSEHNITHVFSSPRSPKQNCYVERVIRTIIEDLYVFDGIEVSIEKQQEVLEQYMFRYNKIRPHESLDMETPYERYVKLSKSRIM